MPKFEFIPDLTRLGLINFCHVQQDGVPAHTAHSTQQYLNHIFTDRWVGKFGPVSWPARSPDLSSCDNALWGIIKPKIIKQNAQTVVQLKMATCEAFKEINLSTLKKINNRTFRRPRLCYDCNGLQVEPFES